MIAGDASAVNVVIVVVHSSWSICRGSVSKVGVASDLMWDTPMTPGGQFDSQDAVWQQHWSSSVNLAVKRVNNWYLCLRKEALLPLWSVEYPVGGGWCTT